MYVLRSKAMARTYVGIAKNVAARLEQHNGAELGGAKSTRAGRPWVIARSFGPFATRGDAQAAEYAIKRWPADDRLHAEVEFEGFRAP